MRLIFVQLLRVTLACVCVFIQMAAAQSPARPKTRLPPKFTDSETEQFLMKARISNMRVLNSGSTKPYRATLTDGKLTHDAHVQFIDEYKPIVKNKDGSTEKDFRDSFKLNIAAYRMDRLLNLGMTPVSIERTIDGKPASVTWWIDDVLMTELDRRTKNIQAPDFNDWTNQYHDMRVFDQLIANIDRNQGNLIITKDWKLWTIDHTRSFRPDGDIREKKFLVRCGHDLLESMRKLTETAVKQALQPYIDDKQVWALMARRDLIVAFFDSEVTEKGLDAVITGMPRSTPKVTVP